MLHGYVSHLLSYQYETSTILKHISVVVVRNKDYGYVLLQRGDLKRYTDAIKRVLVSGAHRTRFRLHPHHLHAFARLDTTSDLVRLCDACMVMVGTIGTYRKSELIAADVCDWVEGQDCDSRSGLVLGAVMNVRAQKN